MKIILSGPLSVVLLLQSIVVGRCASEDWPQWRGPNRDGISAETGLLQEWPAGGPGLIWKGRGLGSGHSSVIIAGPQIFTIGDKGEHNYVVALDRADGKLLWETELGQSGATGWGGFIGPRCTPTVADGLVYAVGQYGEIACIEAASGAVKWRKDCQKDFGGQIPEWGYTSMPLVDAEKVIFTPGGSAGDLVALNKTNGALIWRSKELTDPIHYAPPILGVIGGVRQCIELTERSVVGLAAEDGRLLWRATRRGATAVIPTPIFWENYVYVTSEYGTGCNLFRITPGGGKFLAGQIYANKVMANHHGGVIKVGNYVYGYSAGKGWTCQDFLNGQAVWEEKNKLGKGSIAYADKRLYLRAEDGKGTVALIEAIPGGYREKGRFDPPDRSALNSWAHLVIAGARLYIRDQDVLLCYDVKAK
jgi:outer membrane protein assembly factor BamB